MGKILAEGNRSFELIVNPNKFEIVKICLLMKRVFTRYSRDTRDLVGDARDRHVCRYTYNTGQLVVDNGFRYQWAYRQPLICSIINLSILGEAWINFAVSTGARARAPTGRFTTSRVSATLCSSGFPVKELKRWHIVFLSYLNVTINLVDPVKWRGVLSAFTFRQVRLAYLCICKDAPHQGQGGVRCEVIL